MFVCRTGGCGLFSFPYSLEGVVDGVLSGYLADSLFSMNYYKARHRLLLFTD